MRTKGEAKVREVVLVKGMQLGIRKSLYDECSAAETAKHMQAYH
jgi:hypothetical protein